MVVDLGLGSDQQHSHVNWTFKIFIQSYINDYYYADLAETIFLHITYNSILNTYMYLHSSKTYITAIIFPSLNVEYEEASFFPWYWVDVIIMNYIARPIYPPKNIYPKSHITLLLFDSTFSIYYYDYIDEFSNKTITV